MSSSPPEGVSAPGRSAALYRLVPFLQTAVVLALAHLPVVRSLVPGLGVFTGPLGKVLVLAGALASLGRAIGRPVRVATPPAWALFALAAALASAISLHYVRGA